MLITSSILPHRSGHPQLTCSAVQQQPSQVLPERRGPIGCTSRRWILGVVFAQELVGYERVCCYARLQTGSRFVLVAEQHEVCARTCALPGVACDIWSCRAIMYYCKQRMVFACRHVLHQTLQAGCLLSGSCTLKEMILMCRAMSC